MNIKSLKLSNYRNIERARLDFQEGVNIIYGKNAQGKTNIIESVFVCSTGRSHRTRIEKELVSFSERYSNIKVVFEKGSYENNIAVSLKSDEKKGIAVNNIPIRRIGDLFGELQTVIFSPEDLCIVNDSPSDRRRFMDIQICQISEIYYYHLHTYFKVLKQRNAFLKQVKSKNKSEIEENIFAWDLQLVEHGREIINKRQWFIESLNPIAKNIHERLTKGSETLEVVYKPNVFAADFEHKIAKYIDKDVLYGTTSIGPHKDDIMFMINGLDAKTFGSQGQKRTVVLSCKIAEVEIVREEMDDDPVLLLDDALSELDSERQEMLIEYIGKIQTIITATGMEDLVDNIKTDAKLFYIEDGQVKSEERLKNG